jgi:TonB family protein
VRFTPGLAHPVTFGLFEPVVLLPESLRSQPPDIQSAVLAHELIHVQRRDWGWLIAEEIAMCFAWFHPAAWWLASRIQLAREEVVDELAVLLTGRRKAYVEALLAFSDSISVVPTAAFAKRRHLFRRIALVSKEDVMSSRRIVASCAVMALVVLGGSWYAVAAFPLLTTPQTMSPQEFQMQPGPLELKALKAHPPATPQNRPPRVHYEAPVLPDSVASLGGTLGVRVTLDELGRVAEARLVGVSVKGPDFSMTLSGVDGGGFHWLGTVLNSSPEIRNKANQAAEAFMSAALMSVRQWRYDPPAQAPLTFTVQMRMGADAETMEVTPRRADVEVIPGPADDKALRVGGAIAPPTKIKDVRPVYPPIAHAAGVTGVVIVEARIGADGSVEEARVLRSIPLLDEAALNAVKQWRFMPTLMNGVPTPIIMTLTINFTMQ